MRRTVLLSGGTLAGIVLAEESRWLGWLKERQESNSIRVSQMSLIKVGRFIRRQIESDGIFHGDILEKFLKRHIAPHIVVGVSAVSLALYERLAIRNDGDDLELFGLCVAIQNEYEYCCWDVVEQDKYSKLWPQLTTNIFADYL